MIAEKPIYRLNPDFQYSNFVWLNMITTSGIGYGDGYARTFLGRIVSSYISLIGQFLYSYMVVIIINYLEVNSHENNVIR